MVSNALGVSPHKLISILLITVQLEGLGQLGIGQIVVQTLGAPILVNSEGGGSHHLLSTIRVVGPDVSSGSDLDRPGTLEAVGGSQDDGVADDGAAAEVEAIDLKGHDEGVLMGSGLMPTHDAGHWLASRSLARVEQVRVQDNPVLETKRHSLCLVVKKTITCETGLMIIEGKNLPKLLRSER